MTAVRSHLRELRQRAGLQQQELAARVGVSRQSLSAIEAGEAVPSTATALELARVLACRVEDLFALAGADEPLGATLAGRPGSKRVALGFVRGRWVAHGLAGDDPTPADGILGRGRAQVRPLRDLEALRGNLLVAGCDPALGLLGGHLLDGPARARLHWIRAASEPALDALDQGLVHMAGLHLFDPKSGEHNLPAVRARRAGQPTVVVNLASWQQGLVSRRAARRFRKVADLPGARVALREPGSGARALLDRLLAGAGIPLGRLRVAATLQGHFEVARAVSEGIADAGIATEAAAAAFGLRFEPLADDRFDLVMHADLFHVAAAERLLDTLTGARFRQDLRALPGYGAAQTGRVIARLAS